MTNSVVRYSDAELAEFKELIDKKLATSREQFQSLQDQILEITENSSDEHGGDWVDDSSINNDVEMLNNMAIRQRMYIRELENALVRIRNKSYGICTVSGELIDKRRLMAVPTTTKSLAAKTVQQQPPERKTVARTNRQARPKATDSPKVFTKIIRKPSADKPKPALLDDDDDELFNDDDLLFDDDAPMSKAAKALQDELPEEEEQEGIMDDDISEEEEDDENLDF